MMKALYKLIMGKKTTKKIIHWRLVSIETLTPIRLVP